MRQITIQYSHPDEDNEFAAGLRRQDLIPLLVDNLYLAATTADHLAQAMEMTLARQAEDGPAGNLRYRQNLLKAALDGVDSGPDSQDFPEDVLLLLVEAATIHGYKSAEDIPFCAVRYREDDPGEPVLEVRPKAN